MLVALGFLAWRSVMADAQDNATLPYATVCRLVAMDLKGVAGLTNQEMRLTTRSKKPGVQSSDICLHIASTNGKIRLPLNPDGTFTLPISEALLNENPMIVANQPKGSMVMDGSITLKGRLTAGAGNRQRYSSLFFLQDIKDRLTNADFGELPMSNAMARTAVTVQLIPQSDAQTATVVVESAVGRIAVPRHVDGTFHLRYDTSLAKENPWVLMPTNHRWKVVTELQEEAEQRRPR